MEDTTLATNAVEEKGLTEPNKEAQDSTFTTLDYVKELYLLGLEQQKRDRKKLRMIRLCTIFMGIIMATIVLAALAAGPYLKAAINDFHSITMKVEELDIQKLTDEVETFLGDATTSIRSVGEAADTLGSLDMKALNAAIDQLTKTVEGFGKIDIAKLNTSIDAFAAASEKLSKSKLFGGLFS